MGSKGWGFRKAGAEFPYLLFLVSYSLFPCVFPPSRALNETKTSSKGWGLSSVDVGIHQLSK